MSWWKTAKPGDRVVCVSQGQSGPKSKARGFIIPEVGQVCVIRDANWVIDRVLFRFEEIRNQGLPEPGFDARCFRPVQPKSTETGMAILKRILNSAPVREDA